MRNVLVSLAAIAALLSPAPAHAGRTNDSNLAYPYNPATLSDDALSLYVNPASIGIEPDLQFIYVHDQFGSGNASGDSFTLQLGFVGLGIQWVRPNRGDWAKGEYVKYSIPVGVPIGERFALGAGIEIVQPLNGMADAVSWSVGFVARPWRFVSIAVTGTSLGSPAPFGAALRPELTAGLALRPVGNILTMGGDYHYAPHGMSPPAEFYLGVDPIPGFHIIGMMRTDLSWGIGLKLDLWHFGAGAIPTIEGGSYSGMTYIARASLKQYPLAFERQNKVVVVDAGREGRGLFGGDLFGPERTVLDTITDIETASRDRTVAAILVRFTGSELQLEEADEAARALAIAKSRGKKVYAYLEMAGNAEYVASSVADAVFVNPSGMVFVGGVKADVTYFKGTLDKLDIKVQTFREGKYKSFVESVTRDGMSPENMEQLRAAISDYNSAMIGAIAAGRAIARERAEKTLETALFRPREAVEAGLADRVAQWPDMEREIGERIGRKIRIDEGYFGAIPRRIGWDVPPAIAVIEIRGAIVSGDGWEGIFAGSTTGDREICRAARRVATNPFISSAIVRIDSPGGWGLAGENMRRCLSDLKAKKPVVVSMGPLAASAGYMVALPANYIFADPYTLTGSIGVFALKPNISGLASKLGITHETVKLTRSADIDSLWRGLDEQESAALAGIIRGEYEEFKMEVSQARGIPPATVEEIAQGRVWSGAKAVSLRLADAEGGLLDAVKKAKELSGIDAGRPARLFVYPERRSVLWTIVKKLNVIADPVGALKRELRVDGHAGPSAELPYSVKIR